MKILYTSSRFLSQWSQWNGESGRLCDGHHMLFCVNLWRWWHLVRFLIYRSFCIQMTKCFFLLLDLKLFWYFATFSFRLLDWHVRKPWEMHFTIMEKLSYKTLKRVWHWLRLSIINVVCIRKLFSACAWLGSWLGRWNIFMIPKGSAWVRIQMNLLYFVD